MTAANSPSIIKAELLATQKKFLSREIGGNLVDLLKEKFPCKYTRALLLYEMPDQSGEVYWFLVDRDTVAIIEVPWVGGEGDIEIHLMAAKDYEASLSKNVRIRFSLAQELIGG